MKLTKEMAEKIFSAKDYEEAKRNAAEVGYEMSAEEDAELKKYFSKELSDEELDQVAGGRDSVKILKEDVNEKVHVSGVTRKYYEEYVWEGENYNRKYFCPNCGCWLNYIAPVYHCLRCDEWWFFENKLVPNLEYWTRKS